MIFKSKKAEQLDIDKKLYSLLCQEYNELFPQLDKFIFFYNAEPIYISPNLRNTISDKTVRDFKKIGKKKYKIVKKFNIAGIANDETFIGDDPEPVKLILVNFNKRAKSDSVKNLETFDHEFGHHLTKEKPLTQHGAENECSAEAFSALKSAKRFGIDSSLFNNTAYLSAKKVISESHYHYFSAPIFAAKKIAENIDINKLSSDEFIEYSKAIADKVFLGEEKLNSIKKAFGKYTYDYEDYNMLVACAMLDNKQDEEIYRAGKLFLTSQKLDFDKLAKRDFFWRKTTEKMKAHEEETGFILNPIEAIEARDNINFVTEVQKEVKLRLTNNPTI